MPWRTPSQNAATSSPKPAPVAAAIATGSMNGA
jgi:hypothetical protein